MLDPKVLEEAIENNLGRFSFDLKDDTHKFGTMSHGIGVYREKGKYWGNMSIDGDVTIGYGPYDTLLEAKKDLLKTYLNSQDDVFDGSF